jgi:hypothetical protein
MTDNVVLKYGPYSNSRLEVSQCPYRFSRNYIKKDSPKEFKEAANRGSIVHMAIESTLNAALLKKPTPDRDQLLKEGLSKYPLEHKTTFDFVKEAVSLYMENPLKMITVDEVVGVEELLAVDINYNPVEFEAPNAAYRGIADVLMIKGDVGTLIDHKTKLSIEKEDANSFQMALQALLVLSTYPYLRELNTIIHYAAPTLNYYSKPAVWNRKDLQEFKTFLEHRVAVAESIPVENNIANKGSYCQFCTVIDSCPINTRVTKEYLGALMPIQTAAQATEYAEAYMYLEEKSKEIYDFLKEYVQTLGPVFVGDSVAEIRTYAGRSYDKQDAIIKCLQKHQLPVQSLLKVDSKALSDIIDSPNISEAARVELEALTYKKPTLRMGIFKNKR